MVSRLAIGASACTVALVAATFTGALALAGPDDTQLAAAVQPAAQQPAVTVPSVAEVNTAKVDPAAKKALVSSLQSKLSDNSAALEKVAENAQLAWDALNDAQQRVVTRQERADEAAKQASAAQKRVQQAQDRVGAIAASAYRNGGFTPSATELLAGDPQEALDRARTLNTLSESSTRDLQDSKADAALAQQWQDYAEATQRSAEDAVAKQSAAEQKAQEQAVGFRDAIQKGDDDRKLLLNRLADLNGTSVKAEEKAQAAREEAERQKKLEEARKAEAARKAQEEEAARQAAAQEAARTEAAKQAAQEEDGSVVGGVARPATVVDDTQNPSDGGQEEGSPSDAQKEADAKAAAQKQADDEAAAKEAEAKKQAEADARAAAEQEKAAAEAKRKAEEDAAAKAQAQREADQKEADAKAAADAKAEADRKAAQAKADADKRAADAKAAAQKQAEQEAAAKAAAQKRAAERAAAQKAAARAAEQKRAADKAAAAKRAAEKAAADKAAQQASAPSSSKESAIAWALAIAADNSHGYTWGGNGPTNYDCSGFTQNAFYKSGVSLPRNSAAQYAAAPKHVPLSQLQRGDLVFSTSSGPGSIYHVAIYIGNGQVVQARNPSAGISTTPLSWVNNLYPLAARY